MTIWIVSYFVRYLLIPDADQLILLQLTFTFIIFVYLWTFGLPKSKQACSHQTRFLYHTLHSQARWGKYMQPAASLGFFPQLYLDYLTFLSLSHWVSVSPDNRAKVYMRRCSSNEIFPCFVFACALCVSAAIQSSCTTMAGMIMVKEMHMVMFCMLKNILPTMHSH